MAKGVNELAAELWDQGYSVRLKRRKEHWECVLACSSETLDGRRPRPKGEGETDLDALWAAIMDKQAIQESPRGG
jgi:hypothetical protein